MESMHFFFKFRPFLSDFKCSDIANEITGLLIPQSVFYMGPSNRYNYHSTLLLELFLVVFVLYYAVWLVIRLWPHVVRTWSAWMGVHFWPERFCRRVGS